MLEYNKNLNWTWFLFEANRTCGNPSFFPAPLVFHRFGFQHHHLSRTRLLEKSWIVEPFIPGPKDHASERGGKHIWIQSIVAGGAEQKTSSVSCPYRVNFALNRFRSYVLPHFLKPWTIFKCGGCWKGLQFLQVHTQYECIMTILLLHPGSSTARPWRMVVGRRSFPYFSGGMSNFMSASNFQTIFAANFVAEPCR